MSRQMRVWKHHHACVFVEAEQTTLLVDPGRLGPRPGLDDVDAILITHGHYDHFDPELTGRALSLGIPVWAPADVIETIGDRAGLHEAVPGTSFPVGPLDVQVAGNRRAEVHPSIGGPPNRAYFIGGAVFITGDEHPVPPAPVAALVTPIDAPWLRATDLIRYVCSIKPQQVIGIHDGLLNESGLDVARQCAGALVREGAERAFVLADGASTVIENPAIVQ